MMANLMRGCAILYACSVANEWKVIETADDKLLKLPTFLLWSPASKFYAISEVERRRARTPSYHCDELYVRKRGVKITLQIKCVNR